MFQEKKYFWLYFTKLLLRIYKIAHVQKIFFASNLIFTSYLKHIPASILYQYKISYTYYYRHII